MLQLKTKFSGKEMLSKDQMRMIKGGCSATIQCSAGGAPISGMADCDDESYGSVSDQMCDIYGAGTSTSCDCSPQAS